MTNNVCEKLKTIFINTDEKLSQDKIAKAIFFLLVLLFGGLILLLNLVYPLYADDWGYHFMTGSELTRRITSISDIFVSQYNHYFLHGGRSVVHIIGEFLLLVKGRWTDILNSLAYISFVLVIYKISNIKEAVNASLFFLINIMIWFFQPAFGQTILWITGSANYLWGTLIIILYLYMYCKAFLSMDSKDSMLRTLGMFLFGIIAGWTNENTAFGMIVFIGLILLYKKIQKEDIKVWMIVGLIGSIIGYILMISAPGNYVRYDEVVSDDTQGMSISFYLNRCMPVIFDFFKNALMLVMIYLLLLVTYLKFEKNRNNKVIVLSIIFCLAAVAADVVMIASPEFPPRVWFGIITFFIIAIGILYANITTKSLYISAVKTILIVFSLIYFGLSYQRGYKDVSKINDVFKKREQIINEQADKANFEFVSKETISPQTALPMIDEVPSDSTHWINMFYLRYHGIKSFSIEKE